LRIVAERPLDPVIWDPTGPGGVFGTVSPPDIARLAAFVQAVNWQVLYGIDFVDSNPTAAASEAAIVAQNFGSSPLGFEIGNEPDQYPNAAYGDPPVAQIPDYTFRDYTSTTPVYSSNGTLLPSWPAFASAIEAAVPGAPLTGPTGGFDWAIDFATSSVAPRYHLPPVTSPAPTISDLLAIDTTVAEQFPLLTQAATSANIPGGLPHIGM